MITTGDEKTDKQIRKLCDMGQEHLFGFWRHSLDGQQRLFAVHNLTDQPRNLYLDGALDGQFAGRWVGLLTGEVVTSRRAQIELPPYHVLWLVQQSEEED